MNISANTIELIAPIGEYEARRSYLDYTLSVLTGAATTAIKLPAIIKAFAVRIQRAARSVRSAVRKTFAARKAAKAADSGGGSSDPDGRRPHTKPNTSKTRLTVSTFLIGGAK